MLEDLILCYIHFHIKVLTISLYLKICTHSFKILMKTLQEW